MNKQIMIIGGVVFIIALTFFYPQSEKEINAEPMKETLAKESDITQDSDFSFQNSTDWKLIEFLRSCSLKIFEHRSQNLNH